MNMVNISRREVNLVCARKEMSLNELSERSGVTTQNIRALLKRGSCRPRTLGRIARALGVDPAELIDEEEGHD